MLSATEPQMQVVIYWGPKIAWSKTDIGTLLFSQTVTLELAYEIFDTHAIVKLAGYQADNVD